MNYRIDEKGKVFTTKVTKQSVAITARVDDTIVQGMIHVAPENRLKDEMNHGENFIAITDAQIWTVNGTNPIYTTEVLIVNKSRINWIFPRDEVPSENETKS